MAKIEVNNITLNYHKEGSGKALILLHGNGEDCHIFDKLARKLKKHFTVYAIDSRNHGKSSKTDDYSYGTMVEDISQFINVLKLEKPVILGFSDGAIIALMLELKYSDTLDKMILLGINLKPTDFKKNIYKELQAAYQETQDPLLKLMLEEPNIQVEDLVNIKVPSLIVAAQDDLFYRKTYNDMVRVMPQSKLEIMKGHDHGSYVIDQDILYSDVVDFVNK